MACCNVIMGQVFTYKKKQYIVTDFVQIKTENDLWECGYAYLQLGCRKKFVRTEDDFEERFTLIEMEQ